MLESHLHLYMRPQCLQPGCQDLFIIHITNRSWTLEVPMGLQEVPAIIIWQQGNPNQIDLLKPSSNPLYFHVLWVTPLPTPKNHLIKHQPVPHCWITLAVLWPHSMPNHTAIAIANKCIAIPEMCIFILHFREKGAMLEVSSYISIMMTNSTSHVGSKIFDYHLAHFPHLQSCGHIPC